MEFYLMELRLNLQYRKVIGVLPFALKIFCKIIFKNKKLRN